MNPADELDRAREIMDRLDHVWDDDVRCDLLDELYWIADTTESTTARDEIRAYR